MVCDESATKNSMNKEAIDLLIQRHPDLKAARDKLEAMRPGSYCIHRSWGMGQITAYNEPEQKLIIDFDEDKKGHAMDPVFCVDKLDILPEDNILVRQRRDPGAVEEMIKSRPADLVVEILSHCDGQAATGAELEALLKRLLEKTRYKRWWNSAKKILVKDPRVAVPARKTEPYILRDEPVKAEDEILEEFFETRAPKKKIALAAKLLDLSVRHEDIKESLPDILKTLTASLQETKRLSPAERLHGIWVRNDLARFIHEDVESLIPTSEALIREQANLSDLAQKIPPSCHKRFLNLIERCYPDSWQKTACDLLRNGSGKFLTECMNFLIEKEGPDMVKAALHRWLEEQSLKAPLLYWIVKNRHSRKYAKMLHDLIGPRLLHAMFIAIDHEALQYAARQVPLADLLSDDADLILELLAVATPEAAWDLATTLLLNQGFEDLSKKSLLARFIKLFPGIQALISGEAVVDQEKLIVSRGSYEKRKAEYDDLIKNKIPENSRALAHARELGDLAENAEYKMARQDQDTLLARKSQLELDLNRAQITDFLDVPTDTVGIGSVAKLRQGSTGETFTYSIMGAWDSDPENDVLSYQTPLGRALIGRKPGETVKVVVGKNEEEWTVQAISRWSDLPKAAV